MIDPVISLVILCLETRSIRDLIFEGQHRLKLYFGSRSITWPKTGLRLYVLWLSESMTDTEDRSPAVTWIWHPSREFGSYYRLSVSRTI